MKLTKFHYVGIAFFIASFISFLVWIFSKKTSTDTNPEVKEESRNTLAGHLSIIFLIISIVCVFVGEQVKHLV